MGVGSGFSSLSALSSPLYVNHFVYIVYNCTIPCCTVAVYSAMSSMFSKWQSPESVTPRLLLMQIFKKGLEPAFCNGVWHLLVYWHQSVSVSFSVTHSM